MENPLAVKHLDNRLYIYLFFISLLFQLFLYLIFYSIYWIYERGIFWYYYFIFLLVSLISTFAGIFFKKNARIAVYLVEYATRILFYLFLFIYQCSVSFYLPMFWFFLTANVLFLSIYQCSVVDRTKQSLKLVVIYFLFLLCFSCYIIKDSFWS